MGVLKAKRDDVQRKVDREEFTGRQRRLSQVEVWLTSVLTIENQFDDLYSSYKVELQRLCLCGFCSKNLKLSYHYGKRVMIMLKEVKSLSSQGVFDVVTETVSIAEVEVFPVQSTIIGQETLLERVWNHFMNDGVGILGLYGMGGVGKTTLLTQINNKFTEISDGFDVVIWVVVSKNATIRKIQGDIAQKVGLREMEWSNKDEIQRALDIHNVLRRKKFVLLLDDIWEKVNLEAVGIPYPNRGNGCKVAFTTRSRDVCGRMGVDDPIKVNCLEHDKAWDLFQKKVGVNTLRSHPDIPELAKKVAGKCRGLPLALNVIGETMACRSTVQEWFHAIDVLTSSAIDFKGMEDEILPILKYSYDNLSREQIKLCFLYCSMFPEDYHIDKEGLVAYWICEGFIYKKQSKEKALNEGYEILGILVRSCLLMEDIENKSKVKMHDVVREMALWISSDLGKHKERCIVQAGVGLCEVPEVENWKDVRKMSLMNNEIEYISSNPDCPELTTLFLKKNEVVKISSEFFRYMPKLVVLDLSENRSLDELPEEISELASLRYLDLSYTCINQLPIGLRKLKKLIHLNLEHMRRLGSISGISNLWSLRILGLRDSKILLDMSLVKELELLKQLEILTIDISSRMELNQVLSSQRLLRCVKEIDIKTLQEESLRVLTLPPMNLHRLSIKKCGMKEIKIEQSLTTLSFSNLSTVFITNCYKLKDLTWLLLFAQNLTFLEVGFSKHIEDLISEEKAERVYEEMQTGMMIVPLQKLKTLHLFDLPLLKSIYWSSLPFPCLNVINVEMCPNLRKLPLDSTTCVAYEELVICYGEEAWIRSVEWEDEATEQRFLPACKWLWKVTQ